VIPGPHKYSAAKIAPIVIGWKQTGWIDGGLATRQAAELALSLSSFPAF
jgi:hypothetical protein